MVKGNVTNIAQGAAFCISKYMHILIYVYSIMLSTFFKFSTTLRSLVLHTLTMQ